MTRPLRLATLLATTAALSGCLVGPNYKRPSELPTVAGETQPTAFKEGPTGATPWRPVQPLDAIDRVGWWRVFNDPVLDSLERQVAVTNQNVAAAEANYRQSRAIVAQARASFFPTVGLNSSVTRSGGGSASSGSTVITDSGTVITSPGGGSTAGTGGTTTGSGSTTGTVVGGGTETTRYSIGATGSWELDVWGRIRRTVEADRANAQASAADLANATLSAQAQLATFYIQMRALDVQADVLTKTLAAYTRTLKVTQNQYDAGIVARGDVISAQTQVQTTQAQLVDLGVQRTAREHAIAVLTGRAPAALTLAAAPLPQAVPVPLEGLPSTLLERRPDIAGAERAVVSANAQIGVATAAYYPTISLTGSATSTSSTFGDIFDASNFVWSFGPRAAYTLLDFGSKRAQVRQARAVYDRTVADYRQTVLTAFQGVEDNLSALRVLQDEQGVRTAAEASARQAEAIQLNQYRAGLIPFTSVITAQAQSLQAQLSSAQTLSARLQSSVLLIQALGGGWTTEDLPRAASIR